MHDGSKTAVDPFEALLSSEVSAVVNVGDVLPASIERYVLGELEREQERLDDLRQKGLGSANTRRAYRADWRVFTAWCAANGVCELPAAPAVVARYVRYLFDRPERTNSVIHERAGQPVVRTIREGPAHAKTIARHLLTIRKAHRLAGHEDPTAHRDVKLTVAGLRRERGVASKPKAALDSDLLVAALHAMDRVARAQEMALAANLALEPRNRHAQNAIVAHRQRVVRDRALLTLGWSGALRRSELVALDVDDVVFVPQGVEVRLRRSKTNQEGEVELLGIPYAPDDLPCPVRALRAWLDHVPDQGPIFRMIDRHGQVRGRLGDNHLNALVKESARLLGLEPADFGAHSLRSGWITTAVRLRVPEERAMAHSRHQSIPIFRSYVRRVSLWDDHPSLQMFDARRRQQ